MAVLDGVPRSQICANCYFIAIDLGYSVIYMDAEAPTASHEIAS